MSIVYIHRNLIDGKVYIGQTKNSLSRRSHKDGSGYKGCSIFYNAIQKYGWDNFSHAILEECDENIVDEKEKFWIEFFNSTNSSFGYNLMSGGKTGKDEYHSSVGVFCKETHQFFKTLSDAAEWGGLQRASMNDITKQIEGRRLSAGKHPETGEPLHWCLSKEDFNKPNIIRTSHNAKKIINLESGEIYSSIKEATKIKNNSYPSIVKSCESKGTIGITKKGITNTWMYLEDFVKKGGVL